MEDVQKIHLHYKPVANPGVNHYCLRRTSVASTSARAAAAKANGETEVVMWALSWYYGPVEKAFEAKYPFLKLKIWDPPGDELETKLIAEYKAGKYSPDLLTQDAARLRHEHEAGILQEYDWPNTKGWPFQPPHKFWVLDQLSTRMPMYNTKLVAPTDIPRKWEDLNSSKWAGKALISTSGSNWVIGFAYELGDVTAAGVNWDRSIKFWKDVIKTTNPRVLSGFQGPLELLVAGDANIMLMAAGTTGLYNIRRGAPIDFSPFTKTYGDPWHIAMPKNPPHPNAAKLLADWLTSDEGSLVYSNLFPNPTVNPRIADKTYANQFYKNRGVEIFTLPAEMGTDKNYTDAARVWRQDIIGR
ncbi:MAG: futA1 1 [Dehalococcoidia bacterium]|nr:futA1 1 [Dehalococcoidia bacterium]